MRWPIEVGAVAPARPREVACGHRSADMGVDGGDLASNVRRFDPVRDCSQSLELKLESENGSA